MDKFFCTGPCGVCRVPFLFNPALVPFRETCGRLEPLCLDCVRSLNETRAASGEDLVVAPDGAYAETSTLAREAHGLLATA